VPAPQVTDTEIGAALPAGLAFVRRLGVGGQRVVCLVDRAEGPAAIKLMGEDARERAEREVAVGQKFDHPGLARILGGLCEVKVAGGDYLYFLEEFIDGESLAAIGTLELCEALAMGEDLIAAAEYLYEVHHLVHRDIKPPNIMRAADGRFVLLDVGIARHQDLDTLTSLGSLGPGSLGYLAPEQLIAAKGHEMDSRADQFAVGIVIFKALSGRLPFDPSDLGYRDLLIGGQVGSWDGVPDAARPLLERMLQPKAHRRHRQGRAGAAITECKEAQCS
jgi:serine/threonine protein kinase